MKVIVTEQVCKALDLTEEQVSKAIERHYTIAEVNPLFSYTSLDEKSLKIVTRYYTVASGEYYEAFECTPMAIYAHLDAIAKEANKKASTAKKQQTKKVVKATKEIVKEDK